MVLKVTNKYSENDVIIYRHRICVTLLILHREYCIGSIGYSLTHPTVVDTIHGVLHGMK